MIMNINNGKLGNFSDFEYVTYTYIDQYGQSGVFKKNDMKYAQVYIDVTKQLKDQEINIGISIGELIRSFNVK